MKNAIRIWGCLALVASFWSCDVHQFPEVPGPDTPSQMLVELDFTTDMPLHTVHHYPESRGATQGHTVRHTVQIHPAEESELSSRAPWSRSEPLSTHVFYRDAASGELDTRLELELPPSGTYRMMVWSDYIPTTEALSPYHEASDFEDIHLTAGEGYSGSNDFRDAFRGVEAFDIAATRAASSSDGTLHLRVAMERPLAKFGVIATDLEEFAGRAQGLDGFKTRIVYTGYLPTSFNMFLDKAVDSRTGVNFESDITPLDNGEASLGFDYVMTGAEKEAKVDLAVQILDSRRQVVAQSATIRVPLMRSKLTEVRGRFLTASSSSGVIIDTSFDDEFNIEIQ